MKKLRSSYNRWVVVLDRMSAEILEKIDISANHEEYIQSLIVSKRKEFPHAKVFKIKSKGTRII